MAEGDRWPLPETAGAPATGRDSCLTAHHALRVFEHSPSLRKREFPAWTIWDVAVIPCVTVLAIFVCSLIALAIAHSLPRLSWALHHRAGTGAADRCRLADRKLSAGDRVHGGDRSPPEQ